MLVNSYNREPWGETFRAALEANGAHPVLHGAIVIRQWQCKGAGPSSSTVHGSGGSDGVMCWQVTGVFPNTQQGGEEAEKFIHRRSRSYLPGKIYLVIETHVSLEETTTIRLGR